jgi:H+/Cl- antiporter ClcA
MSTDARGLPSVLTHTLKWFALASLVALLAGSASALFLLTLDWATRTREAHPWMIALLPAAGGLCAWAYWKVGRSVEAGNNLLIDEVHDPKAVVPLRMAPLILFSTVMSHLFGASVGREGTAVQMGGALSDQLTRLFKLQPPDRRLLLMAGISAGFASVFGTPLAGAVFGLEVLAIGRFRHDALLPCLLAAVMADQVTRLWGVHHAVYAVGALPALSIHSLTATLAAGAAFGLVAMLFAASSHALSARMARWVPLSPWRPVVGGAAIALTVWALDGWRYIGLGLPAMAEAFTGPVPVWDFAAKMLSTVASLGTGFKGGEVTPLFFIGASLGNALAPVLHMPVGTLAALGFVAVFAGAANTPLACTLLAVEVFGAPIAVLAALACTMSYLCSGQQGIYKAQRRDDAKVR